MDHNPETLKYTIGQQICWRNVFTDTLEEGPVTNVGFYGIDVRFDNDEYTIPFEHIIQQ